MTAMQVMYIAHCGDSGAVMACTSYDLHFPLRLTTDHKPNRADEHARIQAANGNIDEQHNRVVSEPKPHNGRVTLLSMSRYCSNAQLLLWLSMPAGVLHASHGRRATLQALAALCMHNVPGKCQVALRQVRLPLSIIKTEGLSG